MLYDLRERFINLITSRIFVLYIALFCVTSILILKIFNLQIVNGENYMDNFTLKLEKEVSLPSTRGQIFDRNGYLLAYNDLAYTVTIVDTVESGQGKNLKLNTIINNMNNLIKKNGDEITCEFNIYLDENGKFKFSVTGNELYRFLADVYGHSSTSDLLYSEKTSNPEAVLTYLAEENRYGVGTYVVTDGKTSFVPFLGYTDEEILDIIKVRYNLSLNRFQKYISTTVASEVSEKTVAVILENSDILEGVNVEEITVRKYNDSIYFSPVIGYTGKISSQEYDEYSQDNDNYTLNDYVGKTGIEYSMESSLQGTKGSETIYVDNLGKIIETTNVINPIAGNDIYLTIDADLQKTVYKLIEQKIAGILVSKIRDAKTIEQTGRNRLIPIYDVYFALINNNVIDLNHMSKEYAGENEKFVYNAFLNKQSSVCEKLEEYMLSSNTAYKDLSDEYKAYESFIITMLASQDYGVILTDKIDTNDQTYINWKIQENISIKEYLLYAISQQWIDISKLNLKNDYADSGEIYEALVEYTLNNLVTNSEFNKKLYKYMLLNDVITGRNICMILWEQDIIQIDSAEIRKLKSGQISSYGFMVNLISTITITPAQLGLAPCSGSCVITDPNTGEVLALVSYPGYDNNRLSGNADSSYLAKLNLDLSKPLWNYATQQKTAPGSTFKMLSSIAGYEEGVISTGSTIQCTGIYDKLNGTLHKCWVYPGSHGSLNVSGAIENSCNYFFYEVGYRLANNGAGYNDSYGIERLYKYADMFGLSEKSGVEITESEPEVSNQYPVASAIGQGTHNYTTVGLARYVTAIANNGTVYNLSLIKDIYEPTGLQIYAYTPSVRNQVELSNEIWNAVHIGMKRVVEKKPYFSGFPIPSAGKTGTAQEAANKSNHALYVGYAPYENPEIAISLRIANGYSSDLTAQLAKDIYSYYFNITAQDQLVNGVASDANGTIGGD